MTSTSPERSSATADTALTRWVFALMGGLWVLLSALALLTGHTVPGLVSLGVAGLYAVALVALERRPAALRRTPADR